MKMTAAVTDDPKWPPLLATRLDFLADIVNILRGYEEMDVGGENFIFLQVKVQWTYIEHSVMSHPEKVVLDSRFMESNRLESVDE